MRALGADINSGDYDARTVCDLIRTKFLVLLVVVVVLCCIGVVLRSDGVLRGADACTVWPD